MSPKFALTDQSFPSMCPQDKGSNLAQCSAEYYSAVIYDKKYIVVISD